MSSMPEEVKRDAGIIGSCELFNMDTGDSGLWEEWY